MDINKETIKLARRVPTPAAHRAVQAALGVLDMQPARKPAPLPRWAVAAAAAVTAVALVAAVPPLRDGAVNLTLDALGGAMPQTDRVNPAAGGVTPRPTTATPTANPNSAFLHYGDPYKPLATISTFPNVSQTVNGITATITEAALTTDRLFMVMRIDNAPKISNLWPTGRVELDGQGTSCFVEGDCKEFGLCADLPKMIEEPGIELPVHYSFDLEDQSSDNPKSLGSFTLDFTVRMGDTVMKLNDNNGMLPYPKESSMPTPAPSAEATMTPQITETPQVTEAAATVAPSANTVPETTAAAQAIATPVDAVVATPMPSGCTPRPKYDPKAEGWTVQDIALGNKTLTMAAPSQLKRFDLITDKQRLQASSAQLSKNNGADGVAVWPTPPSLLNDNSAWLAFFDGEDGVIQVMAYDPGTPSMDGAAQKLDSLWSCGTTTTDGAGNQVTQFNGRITDKTPLVSTLLLYRLPEKGVKIQGKTYPFVIVRVISEKQSELWTAILLDCTSVK